MAVYVNFVINVWFPKKDVGNAWLAFECEHLKLVDWCMVI